MRFFHLKYALCATATLAIVSQSHAYDNSNGRDHRVRCNSMRNSFVLNKANVNALVALSCAGLSHTENERRQMQYEDSATMFHQWATTSVGNTITVKGHCAVPLTDLREGSLGRHEIDLTFTKINEDTGKMTVEVDGSIAGKPMGLGFSNNQFLDNGCPNGEANINRLSDIDLGLSAGIPSLQAIIGMIKSQRTGISMKLLENENWVQGNVSGYFSGLGVQYQMGQINGRKLGLAMAPSASGGSVLAVRSANVLDYYEGGDYFALSKDSFGHANGFADNSEPNNHKFQSYPIQGRAAIVGCSALIFDGELDKSVDVDLEACKRHIEQSSLSKFAKRRYIVPLSKEEVQENRIKLARAELVRKVQVYIERNLPKARNYSDRPGVYEQGRTAWTQADITRGYVVVQRSYDISKDAQSISMIEHRMDKNGNVAIKRSSLPVSRLQ